jgi:hypothetical protein
MENSGKDEISRRSQWSHPPGNHCFELDAAKAAENPYIYFPN